MSTHTPGPWDAHDDVILCSDPNMAIGSVFPCDKRDDGDGYAYGLETQANARLIAAAPELLEALREVVAWHGLRAGDDMTCDELLPPEKQSSEIGDAMRAIAKAAQP